MIDIIYQIILTILNKENAGYLSPVEYNVLAAQVQETIYEEYYEDLNRDQNKENRGLANMGFAKLPFLQRQKIYQFSEISTLTQAAGQYPLPDNLRFIEHDGVSIAGTGVVVTEIETDRVGFVLNSSISPTEVYPEYERRGSNVVVYPSTIVGDLTLRYIRNPNPPNWTFNVVGGSPVFNPANPSFQDFELQRSELSNIVIRMSALFGINIRDLEVTQLMEQVKNQMFIKDNQAT